MKGKQERQRLIRQIIKDKKVASQEELSSLLEGNGLSVAQATLSRDIREMRIAKLHDENGYYYNLPQTNYIKPIPTGASISDSINTIELSGPIAVLRTRPGHADMIASVIDESDVREVMGTIAGDDTVLIALKEGTTHDDIVDSLSHIFRGLASKRIY